MRTTTPASLLSSLAPYAGVLAGGIGTVGAFVTRGLAADTRQLKRVQEWKG